MQVTKVPSSANVGLNLLNFLLFWFVISLIFVHVLGASRIGLYATLTFAALLGLTAGLFKGSVDVFELAELVAVVVACEVSINLTFLLARKRGIESVTKLFCVIFILCFLFLIAYSVPLLASIYFVWFALQIGLSGFLLWTLLKTRLGLNGGTLLSPLMVFVSGLTVIALLSWMLVELGVMTLVNLVGCQVLLLSILLVIVKKSKIKLSLSSFITPIGKTNYMYLLLLSIPVALAFVSGWFLVGWNQIPWSDAWLFWSRGFYAAKTGTLNPSYLFLRGGTSSPPVSTLLASIFVISPDVISSLYFMKMLSLTLIIIGGISITVWKILSQRGSTFALLG